MKLRHRGSGLDELVKNFNQSQNQYEAEWEYVPMTGFVKGLSSAYTENKLPDMAILDNPDTPSLIQLGMFEDITEQVKNWNLEEEYYSSILDTVKYEDRYYGLPLNCNSTALFYNKQMLKEAGVTPPPDWQELKEAAEKLTTKDRSGFLMCGIEGEQGAFQILPWIYRQAVPWRRLMVGHGQKPLIFFGTSEKRQYVSKLHQSDTDRCGKRI